MQMNDVNNNNPAQQPSYGQPQSYAPTPSPQSQSMTIAINCQSYAQPPSYTQPPSYAQPPPYPPQFWIERSEFKKPLIFLLIKKHTYCMWHTQRSHYFAFYQTWWSIYNGPLYIYDLWVINEIFRILNLSECNQLNFWCPFIPSLLNWH